jgi:teichuronic acid biosynthesis glycosyltransferase TuaG
MPAYNVERYVDEAVGSVLAQTLRNWELIVINDGSTDTTADLLSAYSDPRVHILHQRNRGVSAARNVGLDRAKGEFITFLDADDVLPKTSLANRAGFLATRPDIDIVDGQISVMDERLLQEIRRYVPRYVGPIFPALIRLDDTVFLSGFYMFRRRLLADLRFREYVTHAEDLIFFLEMADRTGAIVGHIDHTVYIYRNRPGSAMRNLSGLEQGYLALLAIAWGLQQANPADLSFLKRRIASIMVKSWLRCGRPDRAFGILVRLMGDRSKEAATPIAGPYARL